MNSIGERLQYLRKSILKMNQRDFSTMLGVSQGALSEMERNNRGIPMEAIASLMKYSKKDISFSCEWLLTGESDMHPTNNLPPDPRTLQDYQQTAKETFFENLTQDQTALINCYEKLSTEEKEEIWVIIRYKLRNKMGLGSNLKTSKDGESGETKTA